MISKDPKCQKPPLWSASNGPPIRTGSAAPPSTAPPAASAPDSPSSRTALPGAFGSKRCQTITRSISASRTAAPPTSQPARTVPMLKPRGCRPRPSFMPKRKRKPLASRSSIQQLRRKERRNPGWPTPSTTTSSTSSSAALSKPGNRRSWSRLNS